MECKDSNSKEQTIRTICNSHCGGTCEVKVHVKNNKIVRIETAGSEETKHRMCLRGRSYRMQKCNLCVDRLNEGEKPVCVDGCPMSALDAGRITDFKSNYCNARDAEGFEYNDDVTPSVIFKPKHDKNNLTVNKVFIVPFYRNMK
ncbi:MAG: hypothetical protein KGZ79_14435 [Dethiobacter sp.]|jgi:Fe-S-cluster-containing dehydrogenase component|nr:hypothetical protein [Dethiobacter sp.]